MAIPPVCPSAAIQRRAAAVLIGLFLLAALGAYALVATAVAPQITIADPAATGEVVTIGGERYTVRADNVLVPAAAYFEHERVTVQAESVVTYDAQARMVEQVDADGEQGGRPRRNWHQVVR